MLTIKSAGFEDLLKPGGGFFLKVLVIGENGSGKTPFAAQWPKPLFALCENGHQSLAHTGTAYGDIRSSADMTAYLNLVELEAKKPANARKFETAVIDTIDSYQRILIQERLRETKAESFSGWADWAWLDSRMTNLMERLKNISLNVVVLMHVKPHEEQVDEATHVTHRARMKGDSKEFVWDDFPQVGHLETYYAAGTGDDKGKRVLKRRIRWSPDPRHPKLRDQSARLPEYTDVDFAPSDYQVLFDTISGGLDELPAAQVLEEIETEEDQPLPEEGAAGPVDKPVLPRNSPAKKAAAKKTAAKKTAAKPADEKPEATATDVPTESSPAPDAPEATQESVEPAPVAEPEQASAGEDPWKPEPKAEPVEPDVHAPAHEVAKAAKTKADAKAKTEPAPKAEPANPNAKVCGSQPSVFAGKYDAVSGCGKELGGQVESAPASLVKFRTHLCVSCHETALAAQSA